MDSIQGKIAGAYLMAGQSSAEQAGHTLEQISKALRDARYGLDAGDIERFREKLLELDTLGLRINRQLSTYESIVTAWGSVLADLFGEDEAVLINTRLQQQREAYADKIEASMASVASSKPTTRIGFQG